MDELKRPKGRPGRFAEFDKFEAGLPKLTPKRPLYFQGIGISRGATGSTVFVKIRLPHGGVYKGKTKIPGDCVEHKLGRRASWDWQQLVAERDRLQGLADRGEPLEPAEVQTFEKYSAGWLERKRASLKGYGVTKSHIISALNPAFGKKALNAITLLDITSWIGAQSAKLKPATVKRQLATFDAILNDAVRNEILDRNPSEKLPPIKGIESRERFVTDDEWSRVIATCDQIEREQDAAKDRKPHQVRGWLRHYIEWAYHSGMRRSEILDLTWDRVRKVDGKTTVVEVVNTKTGKPRFVTCTPEMVSIVAALRGLTRLEGDTRLFPVSLTTLKRSLRTLWKSTGLSDIRLHDLRRTHATKLIQLNVDPRTVAGRLGHSGTGMLAKVYAVHRGDTEAAQVFSKHLSKRAHIRSEANLVSGYSDSETRGSEPISAGKAG